MSIFARCTACEPFTTPSAQPIWHFFVHNVHSDTLDSTLKSRKASAIQKNFLLQSLTYGNSQLICTFTNILDKNCMTTSKRHLGATIMTIPMNINFKDYRKFNRYLMINNSGEVIVNIQSGIFCNHQLNRTRVTRRRVLYMSRQTGRKSVVTICNFDFKNLGRVTVWLSQWFHLMANVKIYKSPTWHLRASSPLQRY